jgi:hypothetical protein
VPAELVDVTRQRVRYLPGLTVRQPSEPFCDAFRAVDQSGEPVVRLLQRIRSVGRWGDRRAIALVR